MKTLVCKISTSFIEPCCAQPNSIDSKYFVFSSDVWAVFALLKKHNVPAEYEELNHLHRHSDFSIFEDYSHIIYFTPFPRTIAQLHELEHITTRAKQDGRNVIVVARAMGFGEALVAGKYIAADVVITEDDTSAAVAFLIEAGFFNNNRDHKQQIIKKGDLRPSDYTHEHASFLDVLDEVERFDYRSLPAMEKQRSLSAGIGCVHACTYCLKRCSSWRVVKPKQLAKEVAYWNSLPLYLFHNELFHKRSWVVEFIDAMQLYPKNTRLYSLGRIDSMYRCIDLFPALSAIGLTSISIGLESVNQRILASMNKGQNELWKLDALFEQAEKYGIQLNCNILLGMPEEDESSIQETYNFVNTYHRTINISLLMPLPTTPVFEELKELGFLSEANQDAYKFISTFEKVKSSVPHIRTKHLSLEELQDWHKRFMDVRNGYLSKPF